jgi:eukaryotic-like serine/threonine-protein kinase
VTDKRSSSKDGPLPIGQLLDGKYRVRRVLGRGSMGIVYLGTDIALERDIAIKVLAPHYAADEKIASRFRREAVAMASVRNEHVVQIFSYGDHEGFPYFVMEYIPGYTVASLLESANQRGEHLYLDVILGILRQVAKGLEAVHARGIVHRDVKPSNMLVGPGFRVAITDFGLVETVEDDDGKRDLAGTPLYLAPELIRREDIPDELRSRADVYALGVSAYEMLTGDVPFDGATVKEILRRHLKQSPTPVTVFRSDLPSSVDHVLNKALSKDPAERFVTCMDFIGALTGARREGTDIPPRTGDTRILVAHKEEQTQTIYRTALKVGFPYATIMTAADGVSALEITKTMHPDLLLVDLDLPEMNGLELCASLRGDELTAELPVLVIASTMTGETRELLRSLGVREILRTPIELSHLVNRARHHLEPPVVE